MLLRSVLPIPHGQVGADPRHPLLVLLTSLETAMQKLDLNALGVETFSTVSDSIVPVVFNFNEPGVSDGAECTVTLVVSCTCNCHTVKYDCV
jgi:hypothetical protein